MKETTAIRMTNASAITNIGYIIAERIWRRRASSFSKWKATRSIASSRRPEPSPERTIERKRLLKTSGRRSIASASELPASTSWRRPPRADLIVSSSVWSSSV